MPVGYGDGSSGVLQHPGGPEHVQGLVPAHQPGQEIGPAVPGDNARVEVALGQGGAFGGDAHVAHQGHVQPRAHRRAVNLGHHRPVDLLQKQGDALHPLPQGVLPGQGGGRDVVPALKEAVAGGHGLYVAPGTEGLSVAGEQHRIDVVPVLI